MGRANGGGRPGYNPPVRSALLLLPPAWVGGNRTTALRWARILRREGWHVMLQRGDGPLPPEPPALLIALHGTKTHTALMGLKRAWPDLPTVVAATGTDLYLDLPGGDPNTLESYEAADRLIVLQERALAALPPHLRPRARVIHQSTPALSPPPSPATDRFEVLMLAGIRPVKDPLCALAALALLPARSRIRLDHFGEPLEEELTRRLRSADEPRYHLGAPLRRAEALCRLARARLLLSPSRAEGGANVLTEAFAQGTAVVAARSEGALGLLGEDHPGLFPPGDAAALAQILERCERERAFLAELERRSTERAWMSDPAREQAAWRTLLAELGLGEGCEDLRG